LALACADFLWRQDDAPRTLGLERLSIKPGHAEVAMTVLPAMVNGLGVTNCGAIFTFANTTFSLASNTYNETDRSCALLHFVFAADQARRSPGRDGDGSRTFRSLRYLRCQRDSGKRGRGGIPRTFAHHWWRSAARCDSRARLQPPPNP